MTEQIDFVSEILFRLYDRTQSMSLAEWKRYSFLEKQGLVKALPIFGDQLLVEVTGAGLKHLVSSNAYLVAPLRDLLRHRPVV